MAEAPALQRGPCLAVRAGSHLSLLCCASEFLIFTNPNSIGVQPPAVMLKIAVSECMKRLTSMDGIDAALNESDLLRSLTFRLIKEIPVT